MTVDHHRYILDITDRRCRFCSCWRNETDDAGEQGGHTTDKIGGTKKQTCVKTGVYLRGNKTMGPSAVRRLERSRVAYVRGVRCVRTRTARWHGTKNRCGSKGTQQLVYFSHAFKTRLDLLLSGHITSHALQHAHAVPGPPSPKSFLASKIAAPLQEHADDAEACNGN